ncbi:CaiB/BaiF CoA-transferase family protein [Streptomyces sp. NPDC046805]|uniref:CaiB/BaiF CoA transferase family protein n=1 Tax=Streptomyces sp. NPDC046805 TaxID=3155134 RepID=UPI00340901AE
MTTYAPSQTPLDGGPLRGIRVLELGNFIAAPMAGRLLADFGAEVVKVERPRTGDELRRWRLHGGDTSLLWRVMGRNKKSVTLDLRTEQGQRIATELIRRSDVVLENFRPGTLEKWGIGPERMREVNPGVVLVRISGYGQSGPYRDNPGFGGVAEGIGGLRHLTGYPELPPTRVGVSLADSVAGLYAVVGALMGLVRRDRTSSGEVVDVALYEAIYSLTESLVPDYDAFGVLRGPSGTALPGIVPSNTYRTADGKFVVVSGNSDAIFRRLMVLVDRPDLAADPRLADNAGRSAHAAEIDEAIGRWTGGRGLDEALTGLSEADVPAGPIYTAEDIVKDPHYAARGMHERHPVRIEGTRETEVIFPGIVPKLADDPGRTRWLGPELGAHTHEVLEEIGVDAEARARLSEQGVI